MVHPQIMIIHKEDCAKLCATAELKRCSSLKNLIGKGYRPCQCVLDEYVAARRKRNQSIIDRVEYNYLFTPGSQVFHRKDCGTMLFATEIRGAMHYQSCISKGRRPCKLCNPKESDGDVLNAYHLPIKSVCASMEDQPSRAELRAISRHRQAAAERMVIENNAHLPSERKADLYTLTTSSYSFFAEKGYKCFHLRNCKKVSNLKNLQGFSVFDDACRAGYRPCKHCKPSCKHDIVVSLPIYTVERSEASPNMLNDFCSQNGLMCREDGDLFYVETSVGIWRLDISKSPYRLEHINLLKTPDNRTRFHNQPRIFLSPLDAVYYIKRHDECLKFQWNETEYIPIEDIPKQSKFKGE